MLQLLQRLKASVAPSPSAQRGAGCAVRYRSAACSCKCASFISVPARYFARPLLPRVLQRAAVGTRQVVRFQQQAQARESICWMLPAKFGSVSASFAIALQLRCSRCNAL
jgi:hypothetical protein